MIAWHRERPANGLLPDWFPVRTGSSLAMPAGVTAGAGGQGVPDKVVGLRYVVTCGCSCPQNSPYSAKPPPKSRSARLNVVNARWTGLPGLPGIPARSRQEDSGPAADKDKRPGFSKPPGARQVCWSPRSSPSRAAAQLALAWFCALRTLDGLLSGAVKHPRGADRHICGLAGARTTRLCLLPAKTGHPTPMCRPHSAYHLRTQAPVTGGRPALARPARPRP
jgi:hypothetical protein